MTEVSTKCFFSYPSEPLPALQLKYIPYLDFMAAEVSSLQLYIQLSFHLLRMPVDRRPFTGGGSTKLAETTPDRSCALDESCIWSLQSISVSPLWAWKVGWGSPGNRHTVGACGATFQNPGGTRSRHQNYDFPPFFLPACICRYCDRGCASV